jgi:hypothetical protein
MVFLVVICALDKVFEIRGCGVFRTPYNAPPLTGNNDFFIAKQVAQPGSSKPVKTPLLNKKMA